MPSGNGPDKPVPLVNADEDLARAVDKAKTLIKAKDYATAIELLSALTDRADTTGVVEVAAQRRYVSIRIQVHELIGQMPPEGLKLYRQLFDPGAAELYRRGVADGNTSLLRRIVARRLHSSFGAKALETLGAIHFDRGRFVEAARYWTQVLSVDPAGERRPLLLAKIAAARHLGGDLRGAERAAAALGKEYPKATWTLGGRRRLLGAFVADVRRGPVALPRAPREFRDSWPGYGAVPDGVATMGEADVVAAGRWRHPAPTGAAGRDEELVVAQESFLQAAMGAGGIKARLHNGHVRARAVANPSGGFISRPAPLASVGDKSLLPAMVHPVIVGDLMYYRRGDGVVACDLITGREACRTLTGPSGAVLPMFRKMTTLPRSFGGSYYGRVPVPAGDDGRYTLTAGGGRLFAVANFRPFIPPRYAAAWGRTPVKRGDLADTSELVALSIPGQLKLVWRIGRQKGDDEIVRNCKFLSAPAYEAGRLYVLAMHVDNYYLLCLDAETGGLVWKSRVAQAPTTQQQSGYNMDALLHKAGPPALADGRVFVTTNGGIVAAFDAAEGQILWAYQYPSHFDAFTGVRSRRVYPWGASGAAYPVNPVIAAGGRIVCLPSDSENLLVLSAEDGRMLWDPPREGQCDLSAAGGGRVLLSGPGLRLFTPASRSSRAFGAQGIHGRPAVTPTTILASGQDRIYRLDLGAAAVTPSVLVRGAEVPGLLGNLVSVRGMLVAANAAGVCSYVSYPQARRGLTKRLAAAASGADRAALLQRRGEFALDGKRFADALADFLAVEKLAAEGEGAIQAPGLGSRIYACYIALGNRAGDDPDRMLEWFAMAGRYARTIQEEAHMKLRIAKAHVHKARWMQARARAKEKKNDVDTPVEEKLRHRALGEVALGIRAARELARDFPDQELVDASVGAEAGDRTRFGPAAELHHAKTLATRWIGRWIDEFGRACYITFDADAQRALARARAAEKPEGLAAVADKWPNSLWADDARLAAAELYARTAPDDPAKARDALARAETQLYEVVFNSPDRPMRISATVGLATINLRRGRETIAAGNCDRARELATDETGVLNDVDVAFLDQKGKLSTVLRELQSRLSNVRGPSPAEFAQVRPPLREIFNVRGGSVYVVRDQEFRPVRLGQRVAVLQGKRLTLVNTSARDSESAITWVGLTGIDPEALKKHDRTVPGMRLVGAFSGDGKILALADRAALRGFDVRTAKAVWARTMAEIGIVGFTQMGVGDGALVASDRQGRVVCVDLSDGRVRWWKNPLTGRRGSLARPPFIARGLVFCPYDGARALVCLDLATGETMKRWQGTMAVQPMPADDGPVVVLDDDGLSAFDPADIRQPVWRHAYPGADRPAILAAGGAFVVVSPGQTSTTLEVLSMTGGRKIATLTTARAGEPPGYPLDAWLDGESLYVACASTGAPARGGPWPLRKTYFGMLSQTRGLGLLKFRIGAGPRPVWRFVAEKDPSWIAFVLPVTMGKEHVVVVAKPYSGAGTAKAFVLAAGSGKPVAEIELLPGGKVAGAAPPRLGAIGPAVMTNGRLCVETSEGMTVYGN